MKGVLLCAIVLLASAGVVLGWGPEGHAIIVDIAQSMLTQQALAGVQKWIPGETMQDVSSDADTYDHTPEGSWSEPLHYVNMNKGQLNFSMDVDCSTSPGCVVSAILNYTKIMLSQYQKHGQVGDMPEPNAFVFLIHFVGDAHQPLHVGYGYDEGGNTVKCSFYGESTNLHQVWDKGIIVQYNSDIDSFTNELIGVIQANSTIVPMYTANMDPDVWADESYAYVRSSVYVGVSGSYPILGQDYYDANLPIVKERLIAAGVRLAALLNHIFAEGH